VKIFQSSIYETATTYAYSHNNSLKFDDFEVFQLAKAKFKKDKKTKYFFNQQQHNNLCDEITVVSNGQGNIINNEKTSPINQNQIHIVFKSQMHKISSLSVTPLTFYCLAFHIPKSSKLFPLYNEVKNYCLKNDEYVTSGRSRLVNLFENLFERFSPDNYSNALYFNQALEVSIEYILTMALIDFLPGSNKHSNVLLEQIKTFLMLNSSNPQALKLLPQKFNYSYTYLSHFFKEKCNQSLSFYFRSLRMNYAKNSIMQGTTITNISIELGYSSVHAFSRAYKSFWGTSASKDITLQN